VKNMAWKGLVLIGCALILAACGKERGKGGPPGSVVLKINDRAYTTGEVEKEIVRELPRIPGEMRPLLATKEGQRQIVDRMLRRELLLQEAEKRKIGDQAEVTEQLASLRRDLMIRALIQEEIGRVKVEEAEVQAYYKDHPDEFSGDKVRARHILVKTEEEARMILDRVHKNEPFETLAKTFSKDGGTASRGGDLDYLTWEQMVPEFAKAVFALKPGEVSDVVKTPFGFHVIKLEDRKKGQPLAYEQVKDQIHRQLLEQRQGERFQAWMKELEGAAKISRDDSLLPVGSFGAAAPEPSGTGPGAPPAESKP
jgi:peptidyl-prolyl cis-trans isomerase C